MATKEQIQEALSQKITSFDQWVEIAGNLGIEPGSYRQDEIHPDYTRENARERSNYCTVTKDVWFIAREVARHKHGVYADDEFIAQVFKTSPWAGYMPHISKVDSTQVAYFPDRAAFENDRPVRTTLGRFMVKANPIVAMGWVQKTEAEWRAMQDPSLEIVLSSRIAEEYGRFTSGVGACMSYNASRYSTKGHHPAEAYDAPGFGLAVIRDDEGTVTARSLVWVNPDDEGDKRFVRCYGDARLLRHKLKVNGYRPASLHGAKLKRIDLGKPTDAGVNVVLPYIDGIDSRWGSGSYGSCQGPESGEVYVYAASDDPEYLHITTRSRVAGKALRTPTSTEGCMVIPLLDTSLERGTCALTGQPWDVNTDSVEMVARLTAEGDVEMVRVLMNALRGLVYQHARVMGDRGEINTWKTIGDGWDTAPTISVGGVSTFLTKKARENLHTGDFPWVMADGVVASRSEVSRCVDGQLHLTAHCVNVIHPDPALNGMHHVRDADGRAQLRKQLGLVNLAGTTGRGGLGILGCRHDPRIVKTVTGSYAVGSTTNRTLDGEYYFLRNTVMMVRFRGSPTLISPKAAEQMANLHPTFLNAAPRELDAPNAATWAKDRAFAAVMLQRIAEQPVGHRKDLARRLIESCTLAAGSCMPVVTSMPSVNTLPSTVRTLLPVFRAGIALTAEEVLAREKQTLDQNLETQLRYATTEDARRLYSQHAARVAETTQNVMLNQHAWLIVAELLEAFLDVEGVYPPEPEQSSADQEPRTVQEEEAIAF